MALEFKDAQRRAVPLLISIAGPSGSGKTFSALLMAQGLAGPDGTVGMIDTENGRGTMYADSPTIRRELPKGYKILDLNPPFTPARYVEAIQAAEKAGIAVLVIDSGSHEWEGPGGCTEIAENNKLKGMPNWSMAKLAHKRFVNCLLSTPMHVIVCLRARDKVKIVNKGDEIGPDKMADKTLVIPMGLQPIAEKAFVFEMLLSLLLDEKTHHAEPLKCPEPLTHLFQGTRLIGKADGEAIRQWNDGAPKANPMAGVSKRARLAAEEGMAAYVKVYGELTPVEKKFLIDSGEHAANKDTAKWADEEAAKIGVER